MDPTSDIIHDRVIDAPTSAANERPAPDTPPAPKPAPRPEQRSQLADHSPKDADGLSELDKHKIERGWKKDPRTPERRAQAAKERTEGEPVDGEPVDKQRKPVHSDPDAEFDHRTRAGRRILELKGNEKSLKAQNEKLQRELEELRRTGPRAPVSDPAPRSTADPNVSGRSPEAATTDPNDPEPKDADFESWAEYNRALSRWEARQAVREEREAARAADAKQRAELQQTERMAKFASQFEGARAKYPDFDEAVSLLPGPGQESWRYIHESILEHERGAELAYYIATHPDETKDLFNVRSLPEHIRKLRDLELRFEQASAPRTDAARPAPRTSRAPMPTTTVQTNTAATGKTELSGDTDIQTYRLRRGFGASVNGGR